MSLVNLTLRLATRQALLGATLAGQRVYDSAIDPLEWTAQDEKTPFIVVYTDESRGDAVSGHDLLGARASMTLILHLAAASAVIADDGGQAVTIPYIDAGLEAVLDLARFDVFATLQNGAGDWAELWRKLVVGVGKIETRRGTDAQGTRFAAREIALTLETYTEPQGFVYPWADIDRMLRSEAELAPFADLIRARIDGQPYAGDFEGLRALAGQSRPVFRALGFGGEAISFQA